MQKQLKTRCEQLERIDLGDYTPDQYVRFLDEIKRINRYLGDWYALKRVLADYIKCNSQSEISFLDIGSGSGEILSQTARFLTQKKISTRLYGLDINPISVQYTQSRSANILYSCSARLHTIQSDALRLPFADSSINIVFSSLFLHHLPTGLIEVAIKEMLRVCADEVIIVDLTRSRTAIWLYRMYCRAFNISELVRHDGELSIRRGFHKHELLHILQRFKDYKYTVNEVFPFRILLRISKASKAHV